MGTETRRFSPSAAQEAGLAEEANPQRRIPSLAWLYGPATTVTVFGAGLNVFGWYERGRAAFSRCRVMVHPTSEAYEFEVMRGSASGACLHRRLRTQPVTVRGIPTQPRFAFPMVYRREDGGVANQCTAKADPPTRRSGTIPRPRKTRHSSRRAPPNR